MVSFICCSVDPKAAEALERNIAATIGVPFEFKAFDNRTLKYGLCKVYNLCAAQAKYDNLCFVHEDVCFTEENWGKLILNQLSIPDCGVIGFAGSILKLRRLTSWAACMGTVRLNYVQHMRGKRHVIQRNPDNVDFSPVVVLDGFCLFVRKNVWAETPFDEESFPGFHGYDLDFTLAVACKHTNYVCNTVLPDHFSEGSFSQEWLSYTERLHEKWANQLPMAAVELSYQQMEAYDRKSEAYFIKFMFQKGRFEIRGFHDMMGFLARYPLNSMSWALLPKYIKYKLRAEVNR